eukprot:1050122-Amphidinium_carterae.1
MARTQMGLVRKHSGIFTIRPTFLCGIARGLGRQSNSTRCQQAGMAPCADPARGVLSNPHADSRPNP